MSNNSCYNLSVTINRPHQTQAEMNLTEQNSQHSHTRTGNMKQLNTGKYTNWHIRLHEQTCKQWYSPQNTFQGHTMAKLCTSKVKAQTFLHQTTKKRRYCYKTITTASPLQGCPSWKDRNMKGRAMQLKCYTYNKIKEVIANWTYISLLVDVFRNCILRKFLSVFLHHFFPPLPNTRFGLVISPSLERSLSQLSGPFPASEETDISK